MRRLAYIWQCTVVEFSGSFLIALRQAPQLVGHGFHLQRGVNGARKSSPVPLNPHNSAASVALSGRPQLASSNRVRP